MNLTLPLAPVAKPRGGEVCRLREGPVVSKTLLLKKISVLGIGALLQNPRALWSSVRLPTASFSALDASQLDLLHHRSSVEDASHSSRAHQSSLAPGAAQNWKLY